MGGQEKQLPLLEGLFKAYFEETKNVGDIEVLAEVAASVGLLSEEEVRRLLSPLAFAQLTSRHSRLRRHWTSSSQTSSWARLRNRWWKFAERASPGCRLS